MYLGLEDFGLWDKEPCESAEADPSMGLLLAVGAALYTNLYEQEVDESDEAPIERAMRALASHCFLSVPPENNENEPELKNMFKKSNVIIGGFALVLTLLADLTAPFLADCFVGYDPELKVLAIYALRLYSICFLLCGFNMFASALFTALNNGLVSGLLSGVRMMGFEASMVILIPIIWGVKGIWLSVLVAEILALLMNICVYLGMNKRYHYL